MNILMLMNRVPWPLNDGGAIGAYNFVKGYAEAGCNVTVLAMNTTRHHVEPSVVQSALGAFADVHLVDIDNAIKPLDALLNLFTNTSYIIQRFVSDAYAAQLRTLLSEGTYDVVHVDGLPPAAYADIYATSDAIISMRAHNVEHVIWERLASQESNPLKRWYVGVQARRLKTFELTSYDTCDVVMAISREDEATIRRLKPNAPTVVVPAGMYVPDVPPNSNYNPNDLFSIGSFDWMPNLQGMEWFAREIWPSLHTSHPEVRIHVAGKKMPASIQAFQTDTFITVGEVPDAQAFMLQHGIMVVPVVSGSGIRIKILEGMALGKTIIATTIAAEGLDLTHKHNVLIADTAAEFNNCLQMCLTDPVFCASIGRNAHAFAYEHYRNVNIFARLLEHYARSRQNIA